jgi:hypothetical protein
LIEPEIVLNLESSGWIGSFVAGNTIAKLKEKEICPVLN